jgi:Zn-dependent peptidase ImmA (M78 family)
VEQFANNFAAALLMPRDSIEKFVDPRSLNEPTHIQSVAMELQVSTAALAYRLLNLDLIKKPYADSLAAMSDSGQTSPSPKLYSKNFATLLFETIDRGRLSARKAAKALGMNLLQLSHHFEEHDLSAPFEV